MGARIAPEAGPPPGSQLRLAAQPSSLSAARQYSEEEAAAFGISAEGSFEVAFAVNEAVTNAIRHGAPDDRGCISLSVSLDADCLTVAVHDHGTFRPPPESSMSSEHGRGLALMAALMDDVRVQAQPGSTTIYLTKSRA
jgi:serine/threonine-protein kinase RsbW